MAKDFIIVDQIHSNSGLRDNVICYVPGSEIDAVVITSGFLKAQCEAITSRFIMTNPHISPLAVSAGNMPILLGIEEAHHSWYIKSGFGEASTIPHDYLNDSVELAAGVVIREALVRFGLKTYHPGRNSQITNRAPMVLANSQNYFRSSTPPIM